MADEAEKQSRLDPWLKSVGECVRWCGRDRNWFNTQGFEQVAKDPTDGRRSLYDVRKVCTRAMGPAPHPDDDDAVPNKADEDAKLTKARRVAQELANDAERGRLRPVEEVEAAIYSALSPVASALDSLPMQIKRACPELSQRGVELVERAIATMRNALADEHISEPSAGGLVENNESPVPADGG